MITRIINKFRAVGAAGLLKAVLRKLFLPAPAPPKQFTVIATEEILKNDNFTIVQIGAHEGNTPSDPLYAILSKQLKQRNGRLLCVEPVKEHFDQLVKNYANMPNVIFENAAIAEQSGESVIYRLSVNPVDHGYPEWLSQLSSLKKERMEDLWDKYEAVSEYKDFYIKHRVEEKVTCITLSDLLEKHNLKSVDLLQIDTEGYELEILKTIDFKRSPIRFINYESVLLHENKTKAEEIIANNGFIPIDHGQDTFCYKSEDGHLFANNRKV